MAAVHLEYDGPVDQTMESTRCGQWIEALVTRVSAGTRVTVLATTTDRARVTCKICFRCIAADDREHERSRP